MQREEIEPRFNRSSFPLFMSTTVVTLLLMVGGALSSAETKAFEITPSVAPTPNTMPDLRVTEVAPGSDDLIVVTPAARQVEVVPNAGPWVGPDGKVVSSYSTAE